MSACTCLLFPLFSPRLTDPIQTLTRQLEAVFIEVSMVQLLRLRTNPQWVHEVNVCYPQKWPTVTQDFTMAKVAILTWRYMYLQSLGLCSLFQPLLTQKYVSSLQWTNNIIRELQVLSLVQRIKYVHHSQATHFWWQIIDPAQLYTLSYIIQVILTVCWCAHLATGLLHCSTSHVSSATVFL